MNKKIFVNGNFYKGDLGEDLLFLIIKRLICLIKPFTDDDFMTPKDLPKDVTIEWLNENVELMIVTGTHLGRLTLPLMDNLDWLKKKEFDIVVFGAGYKTEDKALTAKEKAKLQKFLGACKFIGVRGENTAKILKGMKVAVETIGDPLFSFEANTGFGNDEPTLGVMAKKVRPGDSFKDAMYENEILPIFNEFIKNNGEGFKQVFLPFSHPTHPDWVDFRDQDAYAEMDNPNIESGYMNLDAMASFIISLKFLLSMRLTGILLALRFGIPTFLVDYQFKRLEDALSFGNLKKILKPLEFYNYKNIGKLGKVSMQEYIEKFNALADNLQAEVAKMRATQYEAMERILS